MNFTPCKRKKFKQIFRIRIFSIEETKKVKGFWSYKKTRNYKYIVLCFVFFSCACKKYLYVYLNFSFALKLLNPFLTNYSEDLIKLRNL